MGTISEPSVLKSPKHWRGLHTQGLLRQNTLQATKGVHPAFGKGREQEQSMAGGHARRRRPGDGGPPCDWTPYQQHGLLTFHGTRRAPWKSLRSIAEGRTVHLSDDTYLSSGHLSSHQLLAACRPMPMPSASPQPCSSLTGSCG